MHYIISFHIWNEQLQTKELASRQGRRQLSQALLLFPSLSGAAATCRLHCSYCNEHELLAVYLLNPNVNVGRYIFYPWSLHFFFEKEVLTVVDSWRSLIFCLSQKISFPCKGTGMWKKLIFLFGIDCSGVILFNNYISNENIGVWFLFVFLNF